MGWLRFITTSLFPANASPPYRSHKAGGGTLRHPEGSQAGDSVTFASFDSLERFNPAVQKTIR